LGHSVRSHIASEALSGSESEGHLNLAMSYTYNNIITDFE